MDLNAHETFLESVKVPATNVGPGHVSCMPRGWILCESVVNNRPNIGLRRSDFNGPTTDTIKTLIDIVAPKPEDIEPNAALRLCQKIIDNIKAFDAGSPLANGKGKGRVKADEPKKEDAKQDEVDEGRGDRAGTEVFRSSDWLWLSCPWLRRACPRHPRQATGRH